MAIVAFAEDTDLFERDGFPEAGFAHQVVVGREADAEGVGGIALDEAAIGVHQFLFGFEVAIDAG